MTTAIRFDPMTYTVGIGRDFAASLVPAQADPPIPVSGVTFGVATMTENAPHSGEMHSDGDEVLDPYLRGGLCYPRDPARPEDRNGPRQRTNRPKGCLAHSGHHRTKPDRLCHTWPEQPLSVAAECRITLLRLELRVMRQNEGESFVPLTGGCFCGQVRYVIAAPLKNARSRHCSRCRKAFSGAGSAYAEIEPGSLAWVSGEPGLVRYESAPRWGLCFCGTCGSTLCGTHNGEVHGVTLGAA